MLELRELFNYLVNLVKCIDEIDEIYYNSDEINLRKEMMACPIRRVKL